MKTKPMLDDWEVTHIESIQILEERSFAQYDIPGMKGASFQDFDTHPARIEIRGSIYGDDNKEDFLTTLRQKYADGSPVTFVADIVTATTVQYVVIESLFVTESGIRPDEISYTIRLVESPPPPPPPDPLGGIDTGLLDNAAGLLDSVTGALDTLEALGNMPDISNPAPALLKVMDPIKNASKDAGGLSTQASSAVG